MNHQYTISQLAHAAGVPTSTIRYYERVGLIQPAKRADNNYRVYTEETLQAVRFIRAAQSAGFTLDDIRTLQTRRTGDAAVCKDVQPLIEKRLDEVSQRIQEMRHVQRLLQSFLARCREQDQDALCHVVDKFTAAS